MPIFLGRYCTGSAVIFVYNVSVRSDQYNVLNNIYAPWGLSKSFSKKSFDGITEVIYAPCAVSVYVQTNQTNSVTIDGFYNTLENSAVYSPEEIAKGKKQFEDMYVYTSAHKYFSSFSSEIERNPNMNVDEFIQEYTKMSTSGRNAANGVDYLYVPLECGELPQFMDYLQKSLYEGISLEDAVKMHYDQHTGKYGAKGYDNRSGDWLRINPENGDVMIASPNSRASYDASNHGELFKDQEAVTELADDLATFLRYTYFARKEDDPERVEQLISYIKNKQAYANYDRFMFSGSEKADLGEMVNMILARLIAAGVLNDEDEQNRDQADELMEAVKTHQEALQKDRDRIDREKSELALHEIKEIIHNDMAEYDF